MELVKVNRRDAIQGASVFVLLGLALPSPAFGQQAYPVAADQRSQWEYIRSYSAQGFNLLEQEKELTGQLRKEKRLQRVSHFYQTAEWVGTYIGTHFRNESSKRSGNFITASFWGGLFYEHSRQFGTAIDWYKAAETYAARVVQDGKSAPSLKGETLADRAKDRREKLIKLIGSVGTKTISDTITADWHSSNNFSAEFIEPFPDEYTEGSTTWELLQLDEALLTAPDAIQSR